MNEIQLYSLIMFLAGVFLTKAVFYFDQLRQEKKFYIILSATILQVLDSVHSSHRAVIEYGLSELKKLETLEETDISEYLEEESNKVEVFMELYTLLLIKAVPQKGRKYISFRSWPEASSLIQQLRSFTGDVEDQS